MRLPTLLLTVALVLVAWTAQAITSPPLDADSQRAWLTGHLVSDMQALGTFKPADFGKIAEVVNNMTGEELGIACQFYYLTRAKTEQDAGLFAQQQEGHTRQQLAEARVIIADLLDALKDQAAACYDALASLGDRYFAQVCYASVPG